MNINSTERKLIKAAIRHHLSRIEMDRQDKEEVVFSKKEYMACLNENIRSWLQLQKACASLVKMQKKKRVTERDK